MRNVGIGLSVFGLLLCLLAIAGVKLPTLQQNLKSTKLGVEKMREIHETSRIKLNAQNVDYQEYNHSSNNSEPSQEKVYQDEPNYSKIYKNSVQNHNDYVTGNDGKIYENKPCFNCSGERSTVFINPATGQKEREICRACDGVGQIGY